MKVFVNQKEIALMVSPAGDVGRATARAAGRVRDRAKRNVSVDTGLLRNSIVSELTQQSATSVSWRIGSSVFYAPYQEHGTPPIFARRAPMLTFKVGNRWVSTYSTRGVPAQHYLQRSIDMVSIDDFR